MNENAIKGLTTELHCMLAFSERGILLSQPIVADSRYDFIADINNKLMRIQCKSSTGYENDSYIKFRVKTTNIRQMTTKSYSEDEIDYFYTWYNNKDYLIPVSETGSQTFTLRFVSNNNANPSIHWAKDYELDTILKKENATKEI